MLDFLSRVLSPAGYTCIATPASAPHKGFNHYRLTDKNKIQWLVNKLNAEHKDVYFAIGTLKEKQIEINGEKKVRVAANIHEIKSLILDLDVGEKKGYKTQKDAVQHLLKFCKEMGFPNPLIVSSGYGIHTYWPLTHAVEAETWRKTAHKFKSLVEGYGLLADPARTADTSSVLRIPTTKNFKNPASPAAVAVLNKHPIPDTAFETWTTMIDAALLNLGVVSKPLKVSKKNDTGLGSFSVPQEPASFKDIVEKCQQIHWAYHNQASCPEPLWYHGLQLARHCNNPEKIYRAFSIKHPDYSPENTAAKVAQHESQDNGPTLCTTFENKCRPGGCDGCAYRGKITSPIVLGRSLKANTAPIQLVVEQSNGQNTIVEIPPAPHPYIRTTSGSIASRMYDEDGREVDPEVIYDYDMYPIKRMFDEVEQTEVYTFRHHLPKDPSREFVVPAYLLYDNRKTMETLGRIGVLPEFSRKDQVVGYMLGYIRSLQETVSAEQIYSQFGWRADNSEIVIGDRAYTKDGVKQIKVNDQFKHVLEKFGSKGELAEWRKIINVYNAPGSEEFAFGLMMGFGALAFKFTNYEGAVFNFNGESGSGKSTVLKLIHSIYGMPTEKALLHQDTTNAKLTMLGCYNNLPVTYDEVTNIDPMELSNLTYAISNGRGKESLKQDRTLRLNTSTWQLVTFFSSNGSLSQRLTHLKGTSSGETFRLMERNVHLTTKYTLSEAQKIFAPLNDNYGVAGGLIAEWMVANVPEVVSLMDAYMKMVNERINAISSERFWVAMCAQAMFGAYLGEKLGLHDYSFQATFDHACQIIAEMRGGAKLETKTPVDMLVEYMNANIKSTIALNVTPAGLGHVLLHPNGSMVIRHEIENRRVWLTRHLFKAWCSEKNYDVFALESFLTEQGILLDPEASKALGDNTEYVTGRLPCWMLRSDHALMTGIPALSVIPNTLMQGVSTP